MSDIIVGKLFCLSESQLLKLKMRITILNLQRFVVRIRNNIYKVPRSTSISSNSIKELIMITINEMMLKRKITEGKLFLVSRWKHLS